MLTRLGDLLTIYTNIVNHYIVHPKRIKYVNYISIKKK